MNDPVDSPGDPRIYLAVERTFLAWVRTGIALMGFGFVVARFGLFLREVAAAGQPSKLPNSGFSLPVGVLLIVLGILVLVVSAVRHHRLLQAIDRGQFRPSFNSTFGFLLAGFLALTGIGVAIYLVIAL